jgi:integrase
MAKTRGVYEHPAGSGFWWVQYFTDGKRHREKVGRKSDAIKLYQKRKSDAHAGVKLPVLRGSRGTLLATLIDDALIFTSEHKDARSYRIKGWIVKRELGIRLADSITPQELDEWLRGHCKTPATTNRYKSFFSLCYREGMANGKVTTNPALLVRHRKEPRGRMRFLSRDEYKRLHAVIAERFPAYLAAFVVSVHTGMRLGEQYTVIWRQFIAERRIIELEDTKNSEPRTVHLNQVAFDAIQSIKPAKVVNADRMFVGNKAHGGNGAWFDPCVKAAGIDNYTWHNNRHTFCSWLAMAGASIKEIQDAAGHKTITMAARYAHLSPEHTGAVVDRLVNG